jgi:hypothetical protein
MEGPDFENVGNLWTLEKEHEPFVVTLLDPCWLEWLVYGKAYKLRKHN